MPKRATVAPSYDSVALPVAPQMGGSPECAPVEGHGGKFSPEEVKASRGHLTRLDSEMRRRLERKDILLLNVEFMLKETPKKIERRQVMEKKYGGRAHLAPKAASQLLLKGTRNILVLS